MTTLQIQELQATALRVREHIIRMATRGGCFIGASLSCVDLIVYLYKNFLNVHPGNLDSADRDFLLLSKGHDVPALYGTLAEVGILAPERLLNHLQTNDDIYWHPNRKMPGVEFHSGSLGHLLSVAAGIALDCRLRRTNNRVVVIIGDGELNEGSNWEALLVTAALQLGNLIIIVDRNEFQANVRTEELIPLESLLEKFEAFGCSAVEIDGHDFEALARCMRAVPFSALNPSVIIAQTVRGKGLASIEARADRWFCNFSSLEIEALLKELHGQAPANLTAEKLMVR